MFFGMQVGEDHSFLFFSLQNSFLKDCQRISPPIHHKYKENLLY